MRYLLSRACAPLLQELARSRCLLAFDFDGTLAPLVARRERAEMRSTTRRLLARVCREHPTAIISGRSRADVKQRVSNARVKWVVGNHGLEPGGGQLGRLARQMEQVRRRLTAQLAGLEGVDIEDKRYTLAVHFRGARRPRNTERLIVAAARGPGVRVLPGKFTVNLVPVGAPHKGDALLSVWARSGAARAVYVGDESTDEDVFALHRPGLVTIRIGRSRRSRAAYYLRSQREIDALLSALL